MPMTAVVKKPKAIQVLQAAQHQGTTLSLKPYSWCSCKEAIRRFDRLYSEAIMGHLKAFFDGTNWFDFVVSLQVVMNTLVTVLQFAWHQSTVWSRCVWN